MDELLAAGSSLGGGAAQATLDLINADLNPSQAEAAGTQLAEDFDTFLLLLTTQLKNQDPTEPLDTNEFTNQIVAFTGVEQSIKTNENLEELINLQNSNTLSSAVNYVGQFVDAKGNAGQLENGFANFAYELDIPASSVSLIVTDSAGRAVFQTNAAPTGSGKQRVVWDGVNSFTGQQEPDGTYNIFVTPQNGDGEALDSSFFRTFTTGPVTGAEVINGDVILNVAGTNVPLSDVNSIRQPITNVASAPAADPGANAADEEDSSLLDDAVGVVADVVDSVI
jgi:Flagellar hook capping protein